FVLFGYPPQSQTVEDVYELTEGEVTFSTVNADALTGSFELTLADEDQNELQVLQGTVEAPLVSEMELGLAAPPSPASSAFGLPFGTKKIP
ncbi:MAG: hypothetical protein ACOCUZ_02275, partial [bacterium]